MDVKLKVLFGKNLGQELHVDGPRFFIGRAEDCQLRPKSELVSRHHCAILVDPSGVAIRDFGSRNGTYVNDERVIGERELQPGDRLKIGPMEFELILAESKKRPKVASVKEAVVRTALDAAKDPAEPNIDDWLAEEAATASGAVRETREAATSDTDAIALGNTFVEEPSKPTATPATPASAAPAPATAAPAPATATAATGDSSRAASDVLKKFFNRR